MQVHNCSAAGVHVPTVCKAGAVCFIYLGCVYTFRGRYVEQGVHTYARTAVSWLGGCLDCRHSWCLHACLGLVGLLQRMMLDSDDWHVRVLHDGNIGNVGRVAMRSVVVTQ